ncbi:MAG: hypothetical protein M5U28_26575 [Sandaracinaceae bacterium]|nr:hypothetical protein [Sandaracinaceae bacterium]
MWKLTPDMKLTRRVRAEESGDTLDHLERVLRRARGPPARTAEGQRKRSSPNQK